MPVWSLLLNPDWDNKELGLFLPNPRGSHPNRFWQNDETGETRSPSRPPAPHQIGASRPDQVTVGILEDARYTVENIMLDCSARGNGAGQASPFRNDAGDLVCTISEEPTRSMSTTGGVYDIIQPRRVFRDPSFPSGPSRYELTIVATLREKATDRRFQFSYDPEMDVDNDP
jgi:hypothetical protein